MVFMLTMVRHGLVDLAVSGAVRACAACLRPAKLHDGARTGPQASMHLDMFSVPFHRPEA